jgi:hypothetical protein
VARVQGRWGDREGGENEGRPRAAGGGVGGGDTVLATSIFHFSNLGGQAFHMFCRFCIYIGLLSQLAAQLSLVRHESHIRHCCAAGVNLQLE